MTITLNPRRRARAMRQQIAAITAQRNRAAADLWAKQQRWLAHQAVCPTFACCPHCPVPCDIEDRHVGRCEKGCNKQGFGEPS